jgi:hypothetical protein
MSVYDYIKQLYDEVKDPAYIIRLIDYLISKQFKQTTFTIGNQVAIPLISGVLKNVKTNKYYTSFTHFYNLVNNTNINEGNMDIFKDIYLTKKCTLQMALYNLNTLTVLDFFDQKYRSFLLFKDIQYLISNKLSINLDNNIKIYWKGDEYCINSYSVICKTDSNSYKFYDILEAAENGAITGLYYCAIDGNKFCIA